MMNDVKFGIERMVLKSPCWFIIFSNDVQVRALFTGNCTGKEIIFYRRVGWDEHWQETSTYYCSQMALANVARVIEEEFEKHQKEQNNE